MLLTNLTDELSQIDSSAVEYHPRHKRVQIGSFVDRLYGVFFVANTDITAELQVALQILAKEIGDEKAEQVFSMLPAIKRALLDDVQAAFDGDPAATFLAEVVESYPTILALVHHRLAHAVYQVGEKRLARMISEVAHSQTGIDIHPGAQIGSGFFIDHGTGVVIGETAVVGKRVRIYQGVTLGAKSFRQSADGKLIKGELRHPIVEDDVVIYAHATILGRITIGQGSMIGGNVWVTSDVPPHTRVVQTRANRQLFRGQGDGI